MYSINNSQGRLRCRLFQRCTVTSSSKPGPKTHLRKRTQCWFRLIKKKSDERGKELELQLQAKGVKSSFSYCITKQSWNNYFCPCSLRNQSKFLFLYHFQPIRFFSVSFLLNQYNLHLCSSEVFKGKERQTQRADGNLKGVW